MHTITLSVPRRTQHSASDAPLFNRVTLAAPPFAVEIDPQRRDTAPHSAPLRNLSLSRSTRRVGGWGQEAEVCVMDREGV